MTGWRKWKAVGPILLALGFAITAWGWMGFRSRRAEERAYQLRLSRWGGRSQELPRYSPSLQRVRKLLGDEIYFGLTGSDGRFVGNHRASPLGDATKAQLAELLERQPIQQAWVAGSKDLDDDWIAGLGDRGVVVMLALDATGVTDRSAAAIAGMTNLAGLGLVDTAISDAAVDRIRRLPNLHHFYVGGPNVRAIRLVDHRLLDDQGRPATRTQGRLRLEGRVEIAGLAGEPGNVRVMVRSEGDRPPWESFPYGWGARVGDVGMLDPVSPGVYSFRVDILGIPPGRSTVDVWIDHQAAPGPKIVHYRLEPFEVDLADSRSTEAAGPSSPAGRGP